MPDAINTDEMRAAVEDGTVTIVDALPPAAFAARHIPGAINVAAEDSDETLSTRLPDADAAIVVYSTDAHCTRGLEMVARMQQLAYRNARLYADGIAAWAAAGLPLDSGG